MNGGTKTVRMQKNETSTGEVYSVAIFGDSAGRTLWIAWRCLDRSKPISIRDSASNIFSRGTNREAMLQ